MGVVCTVLVIGVQERKRKNDPVLFVQWMVEKWAYRYPDEPKDMWHLRSDTTDKQYTTTELFNLYKKIK